MPTLSTALLRIKGGWLYTDEKNGPLAASNLKSK